jgi:ATP-dependent Lhr-like helicase
MAGVAARALDGDPPGPGGLDVLAQHILGMACAGKFHPDDLYREVISAAPYAALPRKDFDDVLRFVEDGGYALAAYERYRKLFRDSEGYVYAANARVVRQHRMNIGTIVEAPMLKIRLVGKKGGFGIGLGEVEEYFVNMLTPGDTFMFAGRILQFLRLRETIVEVTEGRGKEPKVPAYAGARMPMTTNLATRVREMLHDPSCWSAFPEDVQEWLTLQKHRSKLPGPNGLLVETFPRGGRWFMVVYAFEGRNAHQTLGMLLTRRLERFGYGPLGFVATDYVLATWSAFAPRDIHRLFEEDMLGDDLEAWMESSSMLRRTFRNVAVVSGLIPRYQPGADKNRRQVTVNADLIYDVLRKHQPDHVLLRATRADAATGLIDLARIAALLARAKGRITHMVLSRVSPLAVPVLLEIGREHIANGAGEEALLAEAEALVAEAMTISPINKNFSRSTPGQLMLIHAP